MVSYADYFKKNRYQPKYFLGDRVFGRWNKIPFVGTVGNDSVVDPDIAPQTSVFVDLPIQYSGQTHHIIWLDTKNLKKLKYT